MGKVKPETGGQSHQEGSLFEMIYDAVDSEPAWKPIEGVVAVYNGSASPSAGAKLDWSGLARALTPARISKFADAGWEFVSPAQASAKSRAHPVVLDQDGHVKIVGSSIDVKFVPTVNLDEIKKILDKYGLSIEMNYDFSPNFFSVIGEKILEKTKQLKSIDQVEFAEPSLIEVIDGRSNS